MQMLWTLKRQQVSGSEDSQILHHTRNQNKFELRGNSCPASEEMFYDRSNAGQIP